MNVSNYAHSFLALTLVNGLARNETKVFKHGKFAVGEQFFKKLNRITVYL